MFETFSNGMRYFDARTVRKCDMYYNTSSRSLYSFSEEEGGDTADSLDIKPPQAVVRHHKSSSSRRREKHSDRRSRRDEKERKSRQHEREDRHRDKHRHRRHAGDPLERSERLESSKRNRDRMERLDRMEGHSRDSRESSRHERKERSTGDRVLEDLRERLLDKRRERREEPRDIRDYKIESRRELRLDDAREMRESRDRRDVRMEDIRDRRELRIVDDGRDRREVRVEEQRHIRMVVDEQFSENELMERSEKRRKRSHKHDRMRERDQEKMEREKEHREKQLREAMEIATDEINEMEAQNEIPMQLKDPKEMTEQELRKERLLEADREMARRKEVSRIELEARRMKRGEKRLSPENNPDPSIVELSDESVSLTHSEGVHSKSPESRHSSEGERSIRDRSSDRHSSDSSESSSDDDEESNESNKGSNGDSNDASDYNNPSPLSVDRLAKSDHSDGDSPGHVDSNNTSKNVEKEEKKEEEEPELPPYLPAIQGCRSVEEFQCLNRIEEGTYGVVYRARDKRTDEIVALKRLKMEKEKEGFPITSLREINTLLKAQHPNIVTVREIVVGSNMDKIFIVMDYVEHDLKSLIETMKQKKQVFIPGEVKCLMQQLLRAVAHLHDNWILHRDLKTSNLLLSHRGILKVGDFGLAREYGSPLRYYTPIVVTLWYRAPELLLSDTEYSTPVDMWSVGCIFAELLRMEALFPGKSEADQLTKIFKELGTPSERIWPGYNKLPVIIKSPPFAHYPVNNLRQRFSLSLSELGIELLNKFLTYDPRQRITAEDALKHEYFTEAPLPIDPQMFPTWPAKSEQGVRTTNASPKPPSGGKEYKQLGDCDDADLSNSGFHMGLTESGRAPPVGGGFHLKF